MSQVMAYFGRQHHQDRAMTRSRQSKHSSPRPQATRSAQGYLVLVTAAEQSAVDLLLTAARRRIPDSALEFPMRITTRRNGPRDAEITVTRKIFRELEGDGGFLATWEADGHRFGLPVGVCKLLAEGRSIVVATPPEITAALQELGPQLRCVHLTGKLDSARVPLTPRACFKRIVGPRLAARLEARGVGPRSEAIAYCDLASAVRALSEVLVCIERERQALKTNAAVRAHRARMPVRPAAL